MAIVKGFPTSDALSTVGSVSVKVEKVSNESDGDTDCLSADDVELKAEQEVVERLFACNTLRDTTISERELDVRKIAMSLFVTYFDVEERDDILFGPGDSGLFAVEDYCTKAEKIYELAEDYQTAKKFLRFLQAVDPKAAKQVVESL